MTTPNIELAKIDNGIASFESRKASLVSIAEQAKLVDVTDINDKESFKKVTETRKLLKKERVQVTNEGKAMRDLLAPINKMILDKEKELVSIITPEENRLQEREYWFIKENEKIKEEQERKRKEAIQARVDALTRFNCAIDYDVLTSLTDEQFSAKLQIAEAEFIAEQERIREQQRAEAEAKALEEARIKKEREELERQRIEMERQRAEIEAQKKAEQERLDAEARELKRQREELEAEKKRVEEEAIKAKREAEAKKAAEEAAIKEAELEQQKMDLLPETQKAEAIVKSVVIERAGLSSHINNDDLKDIANSFINEVESIKNKYLHILNQYKPTTTN